MTNHEGPMGTAVELGIDPRLEGADTTVAWWLLTGQWHPLWPQFVLTVVSLADRPNRPPAKLDFRGATHELLVVAPTLPADPDVPGASRRLVAGSSPSTSCTSSPPPMTR